MNEITSQSPCTWNTSEEQPDTCAHCHKATGSFHEIVAGFFDKRDNTHVERRFLICDECKQALARVLPQKQ